MTLDIEGMAKEGRKYSGRVKRMVAESNVGDEVIDIDYDTLYGSRDDEENTADYDDNEYVDYDDSPIESDVEEIVDWDEDFEQESYSDIDESSRRESVFDVDDSAYGDSDEEFDPEDLMAEESEIDYGGEEPSYDVDYASDDEYDQSLEGSEDKNSPSAFARKLSSGASGFLSKLKESSEKKPKKEKKKNDDDDRITDSAFDVSAEESDSLLSKIAAKGKKTKEDRVKAATDILEVLGIPETFAIEERYYLPEDLKEVVFDEEAPIGYDRRAVKRFKNNVKRSLEHYKELLEERNSHVVTLASELDKKDDVIAKIQYDQEIAQGINIIPTQGDQRLENELMEAQVTISRLRAEKDEAMAKAHGANEKIEEAVGLSREERDKYNELQDDYSKLAKEKDDLEKALSRMKTKMALLEEEMTPDPSEQFDFANEAPQIPQQQPRRPAPAPAPKRGASLPKI